MALKDRTITDRNEIAKLLLKNPSLGNRLTVNSGDIGSVINDQNFQAAYARQEEERRKREEERQRKAANKDRLVPKGTFGFLQDIAESVADPFADTIRAGSELVQGVTGERGGFEKDKFLNNATSGLLGLASYAVPGGMIAKGVGGGLLGALSQNEFFDKKGNIDFSGVDLKELGTGALLGGVTSYGLGKAFGKAGKGLADDVASNTVKSGLRTKLGKKLVGAADDAQIGQFKRTLGTPSPKGFGGVQLFDDAQKLGILKMGDDPSILLQKADDYLVNQGGTVADEVSKLGSRGVTIDADDIVRNIQSQMDEIVVPELKKPLQNALDSFKMAAGNKGQLSIDQAYKLKQQLGQLTKQTFGMGLDDTQAASAYNKVYGQINDKLDDAFKSTGRVDLKDANKSINTAINAKNFAQGKVAQGFGNRKPFGFGEMIAGLGGTAATGNPLMGAAAIAGQKALTSDKANQAAINILRGAGKRIAGQGDDMGVGVLSKLGNTPLANETVQNVAGSVLPSGIAQAATGGPGQQDTIPVQEQPVLPDQILQSQGGGQQANVGLQQILQMSPDQLFMKAVESGMPIDQAMQAVEQHNELQSMLGLGLSGGGSMDPEEQSLKRGIDQLEQLYGAGTDQSLGIDSTTGLQGIFNKIGQEGKKNLDQGYRNRLDEYKQSQSFVLGLLNKARGAGTLNEGEYQVMMQNMPGANTNNEVAQRYFDNLRELLNQRGSQQSIQQPMGQSNLAMMY